MLALEIGSFIVRRVLVDIGSAVDIMHQLVLAQMGYQVLALRAPGGILTGFNGSQTTSLGEITLPVAAGPVTIFVLFYVIEDPCPFNIILGRAWIHAMKVIPSTYNQTLSFLMQHGQVNLKSDRETACLCITVEADEGGSL